jgi:phosphate transport system substrate-binding protein
MMWQQDKKDSAIVSLALLLSLATTPMTVGSFLPTPVLAQSATEADSFPLPETVADGTRVRIDGAMSLFEINASLKQTFEQQFSGTTIEVAGNGADVAIAALIDGTIDIAALARGLTAAEQAQGLVQVLVYREKIAIIVSKDNPFLGSLTDEQFADIFRGDITNWAEVGGSEIPIRFIDRPETSDTRNTFQTYPSFQTGEFATSENATQMATDNTAAIVRQLGNDGISYAMLHHVSQMPNVRVVPINDTLPDNPNYIYSQPLVFAYRQNPNANVESFLRFILGSPEQEVIEAARASAAVAMAQQEGQTAPAPTPITTTPPDQAVPLRTNINLDDIPLWWLLLPIAVVILLLIWVFRSRQSGDGDQKEPEPDTSHSPAVDETVPDHSDPTLTPDTTTELESLVAGDQIENQVSKNTTNFNNYTEKREFVASDPSLWDMEAPADVVNISYPHVPEVSQVTSQPPQTKVDLAASEPPETEETKPGSFTQKPLLSPWDQEISIEVNHYSSGFLDITEDILNSVADAAEPTTEEKDIFADSATFLEIETPIDTQKPGDSVWENKGLNGTQPSPVIDLNGERYIILEPRNGAWAYVTWYLDQSCQQTLQNHGISQLAMRLYDVTDLDLGGHRLVQHDDIESEIEAYIAIPQFDRDYHAEIGYLTPENQWVTIAVSPKVGIFTPPVPATTVETAIDFHGERYIILEPRSGEWAYVTWYLDQSCQQTLQNHAISQLGLRLYDVTDLDLSYQTPQLVQHQDIKSEIEAYIAIPQSDRDYIAEIAYLTTDDQWATIATSPRVRVFTPPVQEKPVEPVIELHGERSIIFQPRNTEWAYVTWDLDQSCQQALENHAISQLGLRLYDVTDVDLSYQTPQLVQEYELEAKIAEKYIAIPQSDRDYITEIGYLTTNDDWVTIAASPRVRVFATPLADSKTSPVINLDGEQNIVLKPRNAEWAYATWYFDPTCQERLQNNGISQLGLRLYDVTDVDLSDQTPQLVQEYELEPKIEEKYLAIPQSDHDYMAEIGYLTSNDHWVTIARSNRIRIFGLPLTDTTEENLPTSDTTDTFVELPQINHETMISLTSRTPKWAYTSWCISVTDQQIINNHKVSQLYLRLYDVTDVDLSYQTPQLVQQYECDDIICDRYVSIPATEHDYMAEIGYLSEGNRWQMIARSERMRVFNRPQTNFWFVVDAELIIHGSTEPGTTVNMGGKPIKIKSDGTFHLRIPFADNSINYVMTAIAPNGEDSQTIRKQFSQENSSRVG